jgi:hypothetical protein
MHWKIEQLRCEAKQVTGSVSVPESIDSTQLHRLCFAGLVLAQRTRSQN